MPGRRIQTPILRLCITFYRFIGGQVIQIDWTDGRSLLQLSWNLAFVLLIFYGIYTQDPFHIETTVLHCKTHKPLFTYFVHFSAKCTYPLVYLLQSGYNFLYGRQIVHLLDSPCFQRFYHSEKRGKAVFIIFLLANHFFFGAVMYERIKVHRHTSRPSADDYLAFLCLYVVFQFVYWLYIALHYCQYAIYKSLVQIHGRLTIGKLEEEEEEALKEVRELAMTNRRITGILSAPLVTYLLLTVFNIILIICLALICQPNIRLAIHIIFSCCYANYITWMNHQIRRKVTLIFETIRRHYEERDLHGLPSHNQVPNSRENLPYEPLLCWIIQMEEEQVQRQSGESRRIRAQELALYLEYFHLNVFHLGFIDLRFLFQAALFIIAYVVFFTQTH